MDVVILAAGLGTRMEPLNKCMSKPMIPVANKPFLEWTIERLENHNITLVVRKEQKDIQEHFSDLNFVFQDKPKGTGHALMQCKDQLSGRFALLNSDELFGSSDLKQLLKQKANTFATIRHENPKNYGVFELDGNLIIAIREKPALNETAFVNCGAYVLDDSIFNELGKIEKSPRGELELTDALKQLKANVFEVSKWTTLTYPWNILDANKMVLDERGSQIDDSAEIRPGAYLEEPIAIGPDAVIGPNCYIRSYSSIGANCKVGNAVEIKNSIIMENSFVSHLSYVGDSIVGRNCNVAAGTLFANLKLDESTISMRVKGKKIDSGRRKLGGIISDEVKFGVNCVVMPGKKIWPGIKVPPGKMIIRDIENQPDIKKELMDK